MAAPPPDYVPPPWLQWCRRHIWGISFVLGCLSITLVYPYTRHVPEPPPELYPLPDYALVDHHGEAFTPATLEGKVWVAGFVFTSCPSTCPAVTSAMKALRDRFDRTGVDVQMVSFTVDPEHDTPAVLADYARGAGIDSDKWRFVTGDPQEIAALVGGGFKLHVGDKEAAGQDGEGGDLYDIAHATKVALVDETGTVRGYYDTPDGMPELFERADRVYMETKRRPPLWDRLRGEE